MIRQEHTILGSTPGLGPPWCTALTGHLTAFVFSSSEGGTEGHLVDEVLV